jgi:RecA-family ATPase
MMNGRDPLPSNVEAEQGLLGAILVNNTAFARVANFLAPEHFSYAVHGRIYAAMGQHIERREPANPVTLKNYFDQDGALGDYGGAQYLARLAEAAVTIVNTEHYGRTIFDLHQRRQLILIGEELVKDAASLDRPAGVTAGDFAERLTGIRAKAPAPRLLSTIDPTSLVDVPVPQRRWLVGEWVPLARATALYGAGGEGKTLLAQMLATACAIGQHWLGLQTLRSNSVLHFCEDDAAEMHRRQEQINAHYGCSFADLGAMHWLPRLGDDNALMVFEAGRPCHTPLFGELLATAKAHDARLIITDTLADIFTGNENDRGQARAFAQQTLGYLARELQGAVIALAHPSRTGMNSGSGESGSTAWIGTFRSQLYLATPKADGDSEPVDPDLRVLTRKKSNAARRGDEIELRWKDGVLVPTQPAGTLDRMAMANKAERVFLALLKTTYAMQRWTSAAKNSANYAPSLFVTLPEREGVGRSAFEAAMHKLLTDGRIRIESYGRPSDHRQRLAPC